MYFYIAYNLCFHSELLLPELIATELEQADVVIRLGKLNYDKTQINGGDCFVGEVPQVGCFLVQKGQEIIIEPEVGVEESLLRTLILGPIMSVLLRQRGLLVLHASGFAVGDAAIAFLGGSGWGKSTLAAAFHRHGYDILTDDVMAIDMHTEYPMVAPSFPQVKLWPESAAYMGHTPNSLLPLHSQTDKLVQRLSRGFTQTSLPLKRIYVLEPLVTGGKHEIMFLSSQESFVEVLRNSRAVSLLKTANFVSPHLYQCTELVKKVPINRLRRQCSLAAIPNLIELIEADLASTVNSSQVMACI